MNFSFSLRILVLALAASHVSACFADAPASKANPAVSCADLLRLACNAEKHDASEAVRRYLEAGTCAWKAMEQLAPMGADAVANSDAARVHRDAIFGLLRAAQNAVAQEPNGGRFALMPGLGAVKVRLIGLAWKADDFHRFVVAALYRHEQVTHHYAYPGIGAAHLALRFEQPGDKFNPKVNPIAVTALLRTEPGKDGDIPVLELINPNAVASTEVAGVKVPLERDLSATFAFILAQGSRSYLRGFLNPSEPDVQPKLLMIEPYQQGKIPVIFAHGLYSEPNTWFDSANELLAKPEFYRRFQVWGFRYPTGGAFLESATAYRRQLLELIACSDPQGTDRALQEIVLVGHSMGGLISKMQITSSCDILWHQVSKHPFDQIRASPEIRAKLDAIFFFEPVPNVSRIIYIASPHAGSPMANRPSGLLSKALVRYGSQQEEEFRQFVDANWDLLTPYFKRRSRPTTIDMLKPHNPLLEALGRMPVSPRVRTHTIVGTGYFFPAMRPGDTIVPISSARLPDVISEVMVKAKHTQIHRTSEAVAEMDRILMEHHAEFAAPPAEMVSGSPRK